MASYDLPDPSSIGLDTRKLPDAPPVTGTVSYGESAANGAATRAPALPKIDTGSNPVAARIRQYALDSSGGDEDFANFAVRIAKRESTFNETAVSPPHPKYGEARGSMQVIRDTFKSVGGKNWDDWQDVERAGVRYALQNWKEFNRDPRLTAAAYHAGTGAVRKAGGIPDTKDQLGTRTARYVFDVTGDDSSAAATAAAQDGMQGGRREKWKMPPIEGNVEYPKEPAPSAKADKGLGQTITEQFSKGIETAGLGMSTVIGSDPATIASQLKDTQIPRSPQEQAFDDQTAGAAKAFDDAKGFGETFRAGLGILGVMARNPKQAAGVVAQSLGMSVPGFAAAGLGAAAGSVIPGVGTAVGAFVGYILGNVAVNVQIETAQKVEKMLAERGVDTNDAAATQQAIEADPEFYRTAREAGVKGGVATGLVEGAVDVATAGLAGKAAAFVRRGATTGAQVARGAAAGVGAGLAQGASEGAGSIAGQAASGEPISLGQAATEAAYGTVAGVPDIAMAFKAGAGRAQPPAAPPGVDPVDPNSPGAPPPALPGAPPMLALPAPGRAATDAQFSTDGPPPEMAQLPPPAPGSISQKFEIDSQGNVIPETPDQRMAEQNAAGTQARKDAWLEGFAEREFKRWDQEAVDLGTAPTRMPGPTADDAGIQTGDMLFNGRRPFMLKSGAEAHARQHGGKVVPVKGGFVVRPEPMTPRRAAMARPAIVDELRTMANLAGWAEVGGKMIRRPGADGTAQTEEVTRTKWIPRDSWWGQMNNRLPKDTSGDKTRALIEKAIAGEPLTALEGRVLDEMIGHAEDYGRMRRGEIDEFGTPIPPREPDESAGGMADPAPDEMLLDPVIEPERDAIEAEADLIAEVADDDELDAFIEAALKGEGGMTDAELQAWLGPEPARPDEAAANADGAQGAVTEGAGGGDPVRRPEAGADRPGAQQPEAAEGLTQPTPEDLRAKDEAKKKADAKKAAEDKAPPASDFTLTGSNRPADIAAANGQQELAPAPAPAPAPPKQPLTERANDALRGVKRYGPYAIARENDYGRTKARYYVYDTRKTGDDFADPTKAVKAFDRKPDAEAWVFAEIDAENKPAWSVGDTATYEGPDGPVKVRVTGGPFTRADGPQWEVKPVGDAAKRYFASAGELSTKPVPAAAPAPAPASAPVKERPHVLFTGKGGAFPFVIDREAMMRDRLENDRPLVQAGMDPEQANMFREAGLREAKASFDKDGKFTGRPFQVTVNGGVYQFDSLEDARAFAETRGMSGGKKRELVSTGAAPAPAPAEGDLKKEVDNLRKKSEQAGTRLGEARSKLRDAERRKAPAAEVDALRAEFKKADALNDKLYAEFNDAARRLKEAQAQGQPAAAPKGDSKFAGNKVFTQEAAEKARAILKAKLGGGTLNAGLDPEVIQAGIQLAGAHIEAGARTFASFVRAMVDDLGDVVRPYLKGWYLAAKNYPGFDAAGMDKASVVEDADVEALAAAPADEAPAVKPKGSDAARAALLKHAEAVAEKLDMGNGFRTIAEARTFVGELLGEKIEAGSPNAKRADEIIELGTVLAAKTAIERTRKGADELSVLMNQYEKQDMDVGAYLDADIYGGLVDLYENRQPNLGVRTSTSVEQQAYSTPIPLAFLASRLARLDGNKRVYEPTAGNGMLLIEADPAQATVNELNLDRAEALRAQGFRVSSHDGSVFTPTAKSQDVVIANPPFGMVRDADGEAREFEPLPGVTYRTREIDHAIAFKALEALKDGGRAVLILGSVNPKVENAEGRADAYNGKSKREFYYHLYQGFNVTQHFTVSGDLYKKQGAAWPVDVIVIEGRGKSALRLPAAKAPAVYDSWDALKGLLNGTNSVDAGRPAGDGRPAGGQPRPGPGADAGLLPGGADDAPAVSGGPRSRPGGRGGKTGAGDAGSGSLFGDPVPGGRGGNGANPQQPGVRGQDGDGGGNAAGSPNGRNPGQDGSSDGTATGSSGAAGAPAVADSRPNGPSDLGTNANQVGYTPASKIAPLGTLMPVNMREPVTQALAELEDRVGALDEYVARELGYEPGTLGTYFGAEQVDALALAVDSMTRGAGFIIGDQTGIGKGRVVAGVIRWALKNGKTPIFVTEKPNLYRDMHGDLGNIGMTDVRPLMTNGDEKIPLDDEGIAYLKSFTDHNVRLKRMADSGVLDGANMIFTTYSQMQSIAGAPTVRNEFLLRFAQDGVVIFDESHNAGGQEPGGRSKKKKDKEEGGPTKEGRAGFARRIAGLASGVFYSSATWAKRPEVMDLYFKTDMALAVGGKVEQLAGAIEAGGVPLQQVVSAMLAKSGQYIRRERSFNGVEYRTQETPVDHVAAEAISRVMLQVSVFDKLKKAAVAELDESVRDEGSIAGDNDSSKGSAGAKSTNFTSVMHNLIGQMLLSLKVDAAVDAALTDLRAGNKVVLTLASTMGSFIKEYVAEFNVKPGDAVDVSFRTLLERYLERSRYVTITKVDGSKTKRRMTDAELGPEALAQFRAVEKLIRSSKGLDAPPISPIDYLHHKLRAAGYKTGEITGRTHILNYSADGPPKYATRSGKEVSAAGRSATISTFNGGQAKAPIPADQRIDVVVLNQAGSTGLSLHASKAFGDQRPRRMYIIQPELNIDTHMQMLGRIHRTGQVVLPGYVQMVADIPAEKRPAAVLAKKMAGLNANTTANRKSAVTSDTVVDFMNEYGDEVAAQLMEDMPDVHDMLGKPLKAKGDRYDREGAVAAVTGRIPLLPLADQEVVYGLLESNYKDLIEQADAMGENALEAKTLELEARTLSSTAIFQGSGTSPFAADANAEVVDVKRLGKPLTSAEAMGVIRTGLKQAGQNVAEDAALAQMAKAGQREMENVAREVAANYRAFHAEMMAAAETEEGQRAVDARLSGGFRRWQQASRLLHIGGSYRLQVADGATVMAYVTGIRKKDGVKNPVAAGAWQIRFALADAARSVTLPLSKLLLPGESGEFKIGITAMDRDPITGQTVAEAMDAGQSVSREQRVMMTGNLLAAFSKLPKGQIVNYTDNEGRLRQGVLMPRGFDLKKAAADLPVQFTPEAALAFLRAGVGRHPVETADGSTTVMAVGGLVRVTTQKSKSAGGAYFLDRKLRDLLGREFVSSGSFMRAQSAFDSDALAIVTRVAEISGQPLQTSSFRDEAAKAGGKTVLDGTATRRSARPDIARNMLGNLFGARPVASPSRAQEDALAALRVALEGDARTAGHNPAAIAGLRVSGAPFSARPIVAALKKAFGLEVVFVDGVGNLPSGLDFDGLYRKGERTIYIAADSTKPFHAVIGHEFLHWLENTAPDAYEAFKDAVAPVLRARAANTAAKEYGSNYAQFGMSESGQAAAGWEELYADTFADVWSEPEFWRTALNAMAPSLAQRILGRWTAFVLKLKMALGLDRSNPLVRDLYTDFATVRAAVTEAMASVRAARGEMGQAGGSLFSRRELPFKESTRRVPAMQMEAARMNGERAVQKLVDADKAVEPAVASKGRLIEDIPNDRWLQGKIDYAKEKGRNRFGVPHMSTVTGYFKGPVQVPVSMLAGLKGQRGEQGARREESLKYIRENWDEVSKQPPYVEVAYNGEAWVSEGNHRIMVAVEKGVESIPVEIRYFDGGQRLAGPLAPSRIPSLNNVVASRPEQIKSATGNSGTFDPTDPDIRRSARQAPPIKPAAAAVAGPSRVKAWKDRFLAYTEVMGHLPDRIFYLSERYKTLGKIERYEDIAKGIAKAFADATEADKKELYTFFTTAGAKEAAITRPELRKVARDTKDNINAVGDALESLGMFGKPAEDMVQGKLFASDRGTRRFYDQYLPRLYLSHLLNEGDWRAIGAGKRTSDMGYLKKRQDIPEEVRRVILGEVKDPAFLAGMAIVRPMRDVSILRFLETISERDSLVMSKSMVTFDGHRVTPMWLKREADRLRNQSRYMEDRGDAAKAEALAARMDAVADPAMEALGVADHTDWKQLPDSPRYGRLRGLYVRKEVHDDLIGVYELQPEDMKWYDPRSVLGYGGIGTKATQLWKVGKVTLNPGSQVRNIISNMVMLQLSGVAMHRLPGRIVQAMTEIANDKGAGWDVAKKYGAKQATFASQELMDLKRDAIRIQLATTNDHPIKRIAALAALMSSPVLDKARDFHQYWEYVGKTAKIIDEMEKGKGEAEAAIEAQKWLFDYSLVSPGVRYLRNAPIGSPFLTWLVKAAPRLAEVAIFHPQRLLPWMGIFYTLPMLAAAAVGGDEDDWEAMKESMAAWAQKRSMMVPVPWRDSAGRIQFTDLGPFLPWTMFSDAAAAIGKGDVTGAATGVAGSFISGGPIGSMLAAVATGGVDPFTDRPIVPPGEPPAKAAGHWASYLWTLWAPPWVTESGFAGKMTNAMTGSTNKYGDPRTTAGQAAATLVGLSLYGVNPDTTFALEATRMQKEIADVRIRMVQTLQDRGLSAERRKEVVAEYTDEMRRRAQKLEEYLSRARTVSPELKVKMEREPAMAR